MISKEICQVIYLSKSSKTTPIIDAFVDSGKEYLIISSIFKYKSYRLSLIVSERRKSRQSQFWLPASLPEKNPGYNASIRSYSPSAF